LRQGRPANDIAVYLPTHDAWASLTPGNVNLWEAIWRQLGPDLVPTLLEAGYNLDFVDDDILAQKGRIEKGKLAIANEEFSIVVLPGIERIPPTTLAKLGEFAQSGGALIATRRLPSFQPGFHQQLSGSEEVPRLVEEVFKKPSARGHFVPEENTSLEDELARLCPPDVSFYPRTRNSGFIHRHTDTSEIYFIANTSNQRMQVTATFRVKGKNAEWWDLFTGEVTEAQPGSESNARLKLDIEPYGSRLLVFSGREGPKPPTPIEVHLPEPLDVSRGWQVTFEGTGKEISMDSLSSWTQLEGLQFFSGRATYQKKFIVPANFLQEGVRVELNLGEPTALPVQEKAHFQAWLDGPVREAAEVYVNGHNVGVIWHPPYELDVTTFLHAGENEVRIVVGNTAVNEMAGNPMPDRTQLTARYGERFADQGNDLVRTVPSGLTGPIRLIPRRQPVAVGISHGIAGIPRPQGFFAARHAYLL